MRISGEHRFLPAIERGRALTILVDGQPLEAYAGETVAAALLASGRRVLRHTDKSGAPRGMFCGMGVCYDCLVTIDGQPNVRACVTPVQPGMVIQTGERSGG
jgi:predicted molibdopterin-dependent oxidoreductase YjgC